MKILVLLLFAGSCNYTVTVDGSKSHALAGKHLVETKWRVIAGEATILTPDSLITKVTVSKPATLEIWGIDNEGLTGRDTMEIKKQ